MKDIRWQQRFSNYNKALSKLQIVIDTLDVDLPDEELNDCLSELEKEGLIQRFEYTHELAWNVMKDYLKYQGNTTINGSRDATREAFSVNLISKGETWMDMIKSRNITSHTYNEETAQEIFSLIVHDYYAEFIAFQEKMESLKSGLQGDIFSEEI